MNVGEISKPNVDRAQIKKKLDVKPSNSVTPSKKVSDLVELSEESKTKYEQESEDKLPSQKSSFIGKEEEQLDRTKHSIDVEV